MIDKDEMIEALKEAGFIFSFDDAYLLTSLSGLNVTDLVRIAELIIKREQPTPSQIDDERLNVKVSHRKVKMKYQDKRTKEGIEFYIMQEIKENGGFSAFWATETFKRAHAIDRLEKSNKIVRTGGNYPWCAYKMGNV